MKYTALTIEEHLTSQGVSFKRYNHAPLFTAEDVLSLKEAIPGQDTKNLFLTDSRGRFFLVVVPLAHRIDLKSLATMLSVKKLSFGSPEQMMTMLGVEPGSVTLLAAVNSNHRELTIVLDTEIASAEEIQCHPLTNDATLVIAKRDMLNLLSGLGYEVCIIAVPCR
jgi:Ala-tRNA(Pro) deacylase